MVERRTQTVQQTAPSAVEPGASPGRGVAVGTLGFLLLCLLGGFVVLLGVITAVRAARRGREHRSRVIRARAVDPWAQAGQRASTPSADELDNQHGPNG